MISKKTQLFRFLRAKQDNESGQALVELALTLPLLVLVLMGAAELARVAYVSIEVTDAAKAAVQNGGYSRSNAGKATSPASRQQPRLAHRTSLWARPDVTTSCICSDGTASDCSAGSCAGSNVEQRITVTTQTTFDPLIHLPGLPNSYHSPRPGHPEGHKPMKVTIQSVGNRILRMTGKISLSSHSAATRHRGKARHSLRRGCIHR